MQKEQTFNNAIKMLNANVEITHNRLVTLENRTSMMAKAIMPVLKDLKLQTNLFTMWGPAAGPLLIPCIYT